MKTPIFAVMRFLKSHQLLKKREEKTVRLPRLLKRIRFRNKLLTTCQTLNQDYHNLSGFESTSHESSFLNLCFYSVSDFESIYIQFVVIWIELRHSVGTWIKVSTAHQTSMKKLFLDKQKLMEYSLSKNHLANQFTP